MAVRAHRTKIVAGIDFILDTNGRDVRQMVDVNETLPDLAIRFSEIKAADITGAAPMSNASGTRAWIALILVDKHLFACPLDISSLVRRNLVGVDNNRFGGNNSGRRVMACIPAETTN